MLQTHLVFNEHNPLSFGSHVADVPSQDGALETDQSEKFIMTPVRATLQAT